MLEERGGFMLGTSRSEANANCVGDGLQLD